MLRKMGASLTLSAPVLGIYAAASIVGGLISFAPGQLAGVRVVVGVLGATTVALVMLIGAHWLRTAIPPQRVILQVSAFLLIAATVGAVRGLVLIDLIEGAVNRSDVVQVVNSAWSAVLWLTLAALAFGARDRYRRRYHSLLVQGAVRQQDVTDWDTHPSVVRVKSNVSAATPTTADSVGNEDLLQIARTIREEIETNIRPLSHRLWFSAEAEEPKARISHLVRDACAGVTAPIVPVAVIWVIGGVLGATRLFGTEAGLLATVLSTAVLVGSLWLAKRWARSSAWWGLLLMTGVALSTIYMTDASMNLLGFPSQVWGSAVLMLLLPISVLAMLIASSAISLAQADRALVLAVAAKSGAIDRGKRDSAFLHNSLQSEMTGMAMQLERAAESGSRDDARAALERVHSLLARSISEDFASVLEAPMERADRLATAWRGICDVTFDCGDEVLVDPRLGAAVQAVEEVIANAVRHGGATQVRVLMTKVPAGITVAVESNAPVRGEAGTGLGALVLASVSQGEVTVGERSGSSVVELTIT